MSSASPYNWYQFTISDGEKISIEATDIATALAVFLQVSGISVQNIEKIKRTR